MTSSARGSGRSMSSCWKAVRGSPSRSRLMTQARIFRGRLPGCRSVGTWPIGICSTLRSEVTLVSAIAISNPLPRCKTGPKWYLATRYPRPTMAGNASGTEVPIWQEPPPPVHTSMEWLKLSGLERLRATKLESNYPPAPYSRLTGARPIEYGEGTTVFEMPVSPWLQGSTGVLPGGVMAFLADSPLGGAVMTMNPPGVVITTSELSMNYLRPATLASRHLRARSKAIHLGRSFALSEVYIDDADGVLLAHGTARNLMVKLPVPEGPFQQPVYNDPEPELPDPYLRPPQGAVLPAQVWRDLSGLEIQRRQIAGDLPPSPFMELFGIRRVAADEGEAAIAGTASGC